jgi:hypothetical protein
VDKTWTGKELAENCAVALSKVNGADRSFEFQCVEIRESQLVEAAHYKPEGHGFNFLWIH